MSILKYPCVVQVLQELGIGQIQSFPVSVHAASLGFDCVTQPRQLLHVPAFGCVFAAG